MLLDLVWLLYGHDFAELRLARRSSFNKLRAILICVVLTPVRAEMFSDHRVTLLLSASKILQLAVGLAECACPEFVNYLL